MEKFEVLTTTTEQKLANQTCEALEEAGIPVMLEHREIVEGPGRACGFRVLVPSDCMQAAQMLARRAGSPSVN